MTDYALKLLKRQEDRAFLAATRDNPVTIPDSCAMLPPYPIPPPPPPALVEDTMCGEIADMFDNFGNGGHETTTYQAIRAGFDNGRSYTRAGTYRKFKRAQAAQRAG